MNARIPALCMLFVRIVVGQSLGVQSEPTIPKLQNVNPEILTLVIQDQWDRGNDMFGKGQVRDPQSLPWAEVSKRDDLRHAAVRNLLAEGSLTSGQDYQFASLIFQHSALPGDLMLAHVLAMTAVAKGASSSRWLAAATLDRYLQSTKQPQVFGTQFMRQNSEHGWSMEPYNSSALSDSVRAAYCVIPLAEQKAMLQSGNSGGQIRSTTLANCK